ncbi:hypothetical protein CAEBREN_18228 [Caenorhabditis brenneri]|uniref:Uncharacterized protein n=1 Tax=Caenorhabditis brenneri TaxID=135651 RepID=G0NE07_CAEBE|nr:hypothetical protein CAEBREN_18228 [Caenorhabditis brenneri]
MGSNDPSKFDSSRNENVEGRLLIAEKNDTPIIKERCERFLVKDSEKSMKKIFDKFLKSNFQMFRSIRNRWIAADGTVHKVFAMTMEDDLPMYESNNLLFKSGDIFSEVHGSTFPWLLAVKLGANLAFHERKIDHGPHTKDDRAKEVHFNVLGDLHNSYGLSPRFRISQHCPAIRSIKKRIPLHIKKLKLSEYQLKVNDTKYRLGVYQDYPDGLRILDAVKELDDQEGEQLDLDKYGIKTYSERAELFRGDIEISYAKPLRKPLFTPRIRRMERRLQEYE